MATTWAGVLSSIKQPETHKELDMNNYKLDLYKDACRQAQEMKEMRLVAVEATRDAQHAEACTYGRLRQKTGLTQGQLATQAGISRSTLGRFERGDRFENPALASDLCDILRKALNLPKDYPDEIAKIKTVIRRLKSAENMIDLFINETVHKFAVTTEELDADAQRGFIWQEAEKDWDLINETWIAIMVVRYRLAALLTYEPNLPRFEI